MNNFWNTCDICGYQAEPASHRFIEDGWEIIRVARSVVNSWQHKDRALSEEINDFRLGLWSCQMNALIKPVILNRFLQGITLWALPDNFTLETEAAIAKQPGGIDQIDKPLLLDQATYR